MLLHRQLICGSTHLWLFCSSTPLAYVKCKDIEIDQEFLMLEWTPPLYQCEAFFAISNNLVVRYVRKKLHPQCRRMAFRMARDVNQHWIKRFGSWSNNSLLIASSSINQFKHGKKINSRYENWKLRTVVCGLKVNWNHKANCTVLLERSSKKPYRFVNYNG